MQTLNERLSKTYFAVFLSLMISWMLDSNIHCYPLISSCWTCFPLVFLSQVENEYGSNPACDKEYLETLTRHFRTELGDRILLYSVDGTGRYDTNLEKEHPPCGL